MSACSGNPLVGKSQEGVAPASDAENYYYNPEEVRLYGRPAVCTPVLTLKDEELEAQIARKLKENQVEASDIPQVARLAKEVVLSATAFAEEKLMLAINDPKSRLICRLPVKINFACCDSADYIKSVGVIFGYAYQGHCYKLPKPQIVFLPVEFHGIVAGDCGCDCGYDPKLGYVVWSIDKLERVLALDLRSDDVKTLAARLCADHVACAVAPTGLTRRRPRADDIGDGELVASDVALAVGADRHVQRCFRSHIPDLTSFDPS
jgi:hypothetical protein